VCVCFFVCVHVCVCVCVGVYICTGGEGFYPKAVQYAALLD